MKYITRTVYNYNTVVTFVKDKQMNEVVADGEIGKNEAKKQVEAIFGKDCIIVSLDKKIVSEKKYRIPEETFMQYAEEVPEKTEKTDSVG